MTKYVFAPSKFPQKFYYEILLVVTGQRTRSRYLQIVMSSIDSCSLNGFFHLIFPRLFFSIRDVGSDPDGLRDPPFPRQNGRFGSEKCSRLDVHHFGPTHRHFYVLSRSLRQICRRQIITIKKKKQKQTNKKRKEKHLTSLLMSREKKGLLFM